MLVSRHPPVHLTYCLNVFPGESFHDQWRAARGWHPPVKPAGLGLRLGHRAVNEALDDQGKFAAAFKQWCDTEQFHALTINGFPYGAFHREPVKASVYRPDWTTTERLAYTRRLADLLAGWLPEGVPGSISTVPCGYAPDYAEPQTRRAAESAAAMNLVELAAHLDRLAAERGRDLCLGLEPEPWCLLETVDDTLRFFRDVLWPSTPPDRLDAVRRHIGVCIDTCHCALAFEDPAETIQRCRDAGIRIAKIQISAALAVDSPDGTMTPRLARFDEPVYFHQTAGRIGGRITRWPDLGPAMNELGSGWDEWRIHYHVPLHWDGDGALRSTRATMTPAFWRLAASGIAPHLEVETYTHDVLPPELSAGGCYEMMARELDWAMRQLSAHGPVDPLRVVR